MLKYIQVAGIRIAEEHLPETFGRLTTVGPRFTLTQRGRRIIFQVVMCACGQYKVCRRGDLQCKRTTSCGCLRKETVAKIYRSHGESRGNCREYAAWRSMQSRCYNKNVRGYHRYGGRGIEVCARWREPNGQGYLNFLKDMGRSSPGRNTLDRYPNRDGNYEPGNCRWATTQEQGENTGDNAYLTVAGDTKCASRWAKDLNIPYRPILRKLKRGLPHEQCLDPKIR